MLIKRKRGWELPESAATPESVYWNRRQVLRAMGFAGAGAALAGPAMPALGLAQDQTDDPTADLYPVEPNPLYTAERELTPFDIATTYNNFYEFGSHKEIWRMAQRLPIRPWTVTFDGLVEEEKTVDVDTLIRAMPLEERVYRHRCVEAWSMVVPWSGFPIAELVAYAKPLASARYVAFQTFGPEQFQANGFRQVWYPWPYTDGLTMAEATNDLSFMVTGLYGQPVPRQNGAPLRLHVPWKYGFKSVKSIVRVSFLEERPVGYWEEIQGSEYGFWANVNPEVPHPRWSQATERVLGTDERVPTLLYNGYGEFVASLYEGMEGEALYM